MRDLYVASSASAAAEGRRAPRSIGLRHAYLGGEERTLCGLTVRYLYAVENAKWSARTPQRCGTCNDAAAKEAKDAKDAKDAAKANK